MEGNVLKALRGWSQRWHAVLSLLLILGAGNNIITRAGNIEAHYFPLRKNNKENNVIITSVKKIMKLMPFFSHSGPNKVYISLASLLNEIIQKLEIK